MNMALMTELAAKYIWWKPASVAVEHPERVAAQVMELGDWDDLVRLSESEGEDFLRSVIKSAEPGQLSERSWHYWHYRLGLASPERVPPLPKRSFA